MDAKTFCEWFVGKEVKQSQSITQPARGKVPLEQRNLADTNFTKAIKPNISNNGTS